MKIKIIIIYLIFFSTFYTVNVIADDNTDEKISGLNKQIEIIDKRIKQIEESKQFNLVFDNFRLDLVGVIISSSGLIFGIIIAFATWRIAKSSDEIKLAKSNAKIIFKEIENKSKNFEQWSIGIRVRLLNMVDEFILAISRISENKAEQIQILDQIITKREGIENFIKINLNNEIIFYNKIFYSVGLFHPESDRVEQAILYFSKNGELEDISTLKKAYRIIKDENQKKKLQNIILRIKKNQT